MKKKNKEVFQVIYYHFYSEINKKKFYIKGGGLAQMLRTRYGGGGVSKMTNITVTEFLDAPL
jgi:hypothetical protein